MVNIVRSRTLGSLVFLLILTISVLPPLFNSGAGVPSTQARDPVVTPQAEFLNYTDFDMIYWGAPSNVNSSLLSVWVYNVSAPDLLNCQAGDLNVSRFRVYNVTDDALIFEDNLQFNGSHWVALNYSLLTISNMSQIQPHNYNVECFFLRNITTDIWNVTTSRSTSFYYQHSLKIAAPTFTYIADTSSTIDIYVPYIRSTIWGTLNETSSNVISFLNTTNNWQTVTVVETMTNNLSYNSIDDRWEVDELNISILIPGDEYKIRITASYSIKDPLHVGQSPNSDDTFVFLAPYLTIDEPVIEYVGRDIQLLNISVASVWDSIHGYLEHANMTLTNFSIWRIADSTIVVNGTFNWNATGDYWYFWNFDVNASLDEGTLEIGETYNITANFNVSATLQRDAVIGISDFSEPFIIDRDPPELVRVIINEEGNDPPTDEDEGDVTVEVSDDARVSHVILSYKTNGTDWTNITMRSARSVFRNFTGTIPAFPERTLVQYRIYINDSQDQWYVSDDRNYTVADTPPLIAYIVYLPESPTNLDPVTVRVNVTDSTNVSIVTLYYSFDGVIYIPLTMTHTSGNQYEVIIPAFASAMAYYQFANVLFRIEATDFYENTRVSVTYAYLVQGTLPGIDPLTALILISAIALTAAVIIILIKIYERY